MLYFAVFASLLVTLIPGHSSLNQDAFIRNHRGVNKNLERNHYLSKRSTELSESMNEFCASFEPTQEEILNSQGDIEEMSSGCNGICSYCQNCPANCYNRILRACKQYLTVLSSTNTKINKSSLNTACQRFVNQSSP